MFRQVQLYDQITLIGTDESLLWIIACKYLLGLFVVFLVFFFFSSGQILPANCLVIISNGFSLPLALSLSFCLLIMPQSCGRGSFAKLLTQFCEGRRENKIVMALVDRIITHHSFDSWLICTYIHMYVFTLDVYLIASGTIGRAIAPIDQ